MEGAEVPGGAELVTQLWSLQGCTCVNEEGLTLQALTAVSRALLPLSHLQSDEVTVGLCRLRESLTGDDVAGSDGSGKGSGNAPQCGLGISSVNPTGDSSFALR